MSASDLDYKADRLQDILAQAGDFCLAVSGGLDSRFLCRFSLLRGFKPLTAFFRGPHLTPVEQSQALGWIKDQETTHIVLEADPLILPWVANNDQRRCYYCKRFIFEKLMSLKETQGLAICDGSNASDMELYRPGLQALRELGVISPLAEAGISKDDIRALARVIGLDRPDQPSRPCLMTRLAYGFQGDADILRRLGLAEDGLSSFLNSYRLRLWPEKSLLQMAESERAHWPEIKAQVEEVLRKYGFWPCEIHFDVEISGFFDLRGR